jgi:hypothetical protein
MMYIDTLAEIQRERHAELLREAEMLRMLKEAQRANANIGQEGTSAETNAFSTLMTTLLTLPDRLKTA